MASEENPDTLPTPLDPTGPCPRCGRNSNFGVEVREMWIKSKPDAWGQGPTGAERLATLRCYGCKDATVVITDQLGEGVHWYPAPGMGILDKQVDKGVASAYDEGMRCLSIGANRAAAVMFRSALHLFIKNKGGEAAKGERHLKVALKHMKDDSDLHKSLWDWADHLNQLGNEGAHPEDYDDVTAEEAEGLGKFVRQLIAIEYEMPARLLRDQGLLKDEDEPEEADPFDATGEVRLSGGLDPANFDGGAR
jgi:hypothetical protein